MGQYHIISCCESFFFPLPVLNSPFNYNVWTWTCMLCFSKDKATLKNLNMEKQLYMLPSVTYIIRCIHVYIYCVIYVS